jgi:hypothetical protein
MARNIRTFSDLDLSFQMNPVTGDIFKKTDTNAIIAGLSNLLLTTPFEKPFYPEYGARVRNLLFEPIDVTTASMIKKEIELSVKYYEPRVNLKEVIVQANEDANRYDVVLDFFIVNNPSRITVNIFLERIR